MFQSFNDYSTLCELTTCTFCPTHAPPPPSPSGEFYPRHVHISGRSTAAPPVYRQSSVPEPSPSAQKQSWRAPTRKGEGPRGGEVPGLCSTQFALVFPQSADKAATLEITSCSRITLRHTLASVFFLFFLILPFGTPIMSYCDAVGLRRSGCLRPVSGPALQRVQQHSVAPCLALTPRFPSCWSHPARASGTSCSPCDSLGVVSPFCHGSLSAQGCGPSPARCRRKWHGSGNLGAPCSGS